MTGRDHKAAAEFSEFDIPVVDEPEGAQTIASEPRDFPELPERKKDLGSLHLLWENRRFLARVLGAGLLLSTLIAFLIPKRYESVARLMPPDNQSGSGLAMAAAALTGGAGGLGGLGGLAGDLLGQKSTSDLFLGVLESYSVEDKIIQEFDLRKVYHTRRIEDARKALEGWTDISVDHKSQILTITVTDKDPRRAAGLAQAYVEELNRTFAGVSTSSGRRERIFLEGRLRTVNQDLEAAEKEFSRFASKNTAIDIKEQGKAMVQAAATLESELVAARSELGELRQLYADGNVRVRATQARIAELESEIEKVGGTEQDGSSPLKPTDADSMYPSIRQLPLLGVPYADLYRKTRVQEALFEMLTQKYELAKVQEAKEIPTVKVLDYPKLPERKSFPPRMLLMLLGSILSLGGAVAWVSGKKKWEETNPANPGKLLAQEVLETVKSAIPWASQNGRGRDAEGRPPIEPSAVDDGAHK